jgi:hypothetical protein
MKRRYFLAAITAVSLSIAACSDEKKSDLPATSSDLLAGVNFVVKPGSMRECDPPAVATLTWDVAAAGVQNVKIFVVEDKAGAEKLFIRSGTSGTAETGPWAQAGQAFILKDEGETKQLGKLIIQPTKC